MEYPTRPGKEMKLSNPLKYTFDGHFLPTTPPDDDTPNTTESDSQTEQSSKSRCSNPNQTAGLAASIQVIANTMLRMEFDELEMRKRRETARLEAQMRQAKMEDEMTQMMLQIQYQIASFISQNRSTGKRKSSSTDDNPLSQ